MDQVRTHLRTLTMKVCQELDGQEIPKRPIWTVVYTPDAPPHVAMDFDRPAMSDLRYSLTIGISRLAEYKAAAAAFEEDPAFAEGIVINNGGGLLLPEETNFTRAFVTNFLWRYLREGQQLGWNETRFDETFEELKTEVARRTIVVHTTLPLSNLKIDIDALDFGDELRLEPASISELERWLNPDRSMPSFGGGPPQWDTRYLDRPAVLHVRRSVIGELLPPDITEAFHRRQVDVARVISALRLILKAPITVIFEEDDTEGMMAYGGAGRSWGAPRQTGLLVTLDFEKAEQVTHVWQTLQTSPNSNSLSLPLRRWESSLMRQNPEDSLIDAWISLEALLLGGAEGELSYRASVRLAEFLGTSGAERKHIYDATRISYRWRSLIVHGSTDRRFTTRNPLQETLQRTTDMLRSALLKVLDLSGRFDPNNLESTLLRR